MRERVAPSTQKRGGREGRVGGAERRGEGYRSKSHEDRKRDGNKVCEE